MRKFIFCTENRCRFAVKFVPNSRSKCIPEGPMRHSVRIVNWLASLLILFAVSTTLHAQLTEGSIAGTVTDASGAAVAGGNVKITNLQTDAVDDTKTDNIGYYRV